MKRKRKGEEEEEDRGIQRSNDFRFKGFNINMLLCKTHQGVIFLFFLKLSSRPNVELELMT